VCCTTRSCRFMRTICLSILSSRSTSPIGSSFALTCRRSSSQMCGRVLSSRRSQPRDQQEQNKRATDLFDSLKKNFCHSLLEAEWIDDNTKTSVVKKCNRLDLIFFTPLEESVLLKNYEELNLTEDYQTNLIKIMSNFKRNIYSTQGTQISGDKM
jgi:hypothetical protein